MYSKIVEWSWWKDAQSGAKRLVFAQKTHKNDYFCSKTLKNAKIGVIERKKVL